MENWKLIAVFAATLTGAAMPAHAELDLSANFGIMSDYIYRGIHQSDAAANGGVDLATGPFYLGAWLADLDSGNGVEVDVYGGLAWEFENGFEAYVGYTAYRYTEDDEGELRDVAVAAVVEDDEIAIIANVYEGEDGETLYLSPDRMTRYDINDEGVAVPSGYTGNVGDLEPVTECVGTGFDQDYDEINIGLGYAQGDFSAYLDYAIGEHENFCGASDNDYDIAILTLDYKGAYVSFGTYGISEDDTDMGEPEGNYLEVGYATTVGDLDLEIYLVDSDKDLDDESRLVMTASYGLGL